MFNVYKQGVCCRARLHRQFAIMLALLLLLHNVAGKQTRKDVPTIQHIASCPDIGYYFKRDVTLNAIDLGPCKLCFCQDNSTAVCWPRDSKRCDSKRYSFIGRKMRENRNRRSPGFTDIFFRDAAREVFGRQSPEQCKPYESSFSEGCPPADWCIGCTVCDCDANGRWDCHTLSFCPDSKKHGKKKRNQQRSRIVKRQLFKKTSPKTTKKPNKKSTRKASKKPIVGKKAQIKQNKPNQNKDQNNKKWNTKKISPVIKSKKTFQKKKVPPKMEGSNKNVQKGNKPITIKSNKGQRKKGKPVDQDETIQFTKMILKKVMASFNKVVNESKKSFNKDKLVQKHSMPKYVNKKNKQSQSQSKGVKKVKKWQPVKNVPPNRSQRRSRRKREISKDTVAYFEKDNIYKIIPKIDNIVFSPAKKYNRLLSKERPNCNSSNNIKYFEYYVDFNDKNTKEKNESEHDYTRNQMLIKSNDLETIQTNNITRTISSVFECGHNGTRTTPKANSKNFHLHDSNLFKNSSNNTSSKKNKTCGQICELKKEFKTFIGGIGRKTSGKKKNNIENKNFMTYFRNFFRRLLQVNKKRDPSLTKKHVYRKRNIIKSLCMNISSCKFDPMDKTLLIKLDQLKIESNNILKSIRIIKGLLKLFDDRELSIKKNTSSIDKSQQNKDILILNAILKDRYDLASTFTNLTETRLKQINYIRDNTKIFIQSMENFALILNDIMKQLRKDKKQRIPRRILRCTKNYQNESVKNATVGEKIQKLKNLLISYNLVQNRFMKGIFDVLATLDKKTKPDINKLTKVSDENYNESLAIDNYTKNIIKNLRKLKILAEKLSFKKRMKRAAMGDDDAIDYFLTLIEYLLKQNRSLDISPVSDGIDLLIEAIKNSPDIKPIQKKVLDSVPIQTIKTDIIPTESFLVPPHYNENNTNDTKIIKVFKSLDEDAEGKNMYEYSDKFDQKSDFNHKSTTIKAASTIAIPNVYIAKDDDEKINVILDTFNPEKNDDKKGYTVFVDDTDEDEDIVTTSTQPPEDNTEIDVPVTKIIPKRTTFAPNIKENNLKNSLNTLKAIKKTKLDWIEENFNREEERREVLHKKETTQGVTQTATRTLKTAAGKYLNPVSSMSRETEDERQGKTINPEYLMYKKQMNLLNSLDYGTEKSVLDSESEEEKYNSESFPFM